MSKKLNPKLLKKLIENPKTDIKANSIRPIISNIRRTNPGITLNAAAFVLAKQKGFSCMQQLDDEDKASLRYLKSEQKVPIKNTVIKKIKSGKIGTTYGQKFIQDANLNAEIYPYIFILENSLRDSILEKFKNTPNWWGDTQYVKKEIQDYAKSIQEAEKKHAWLPARGNHPIYYVNLNHLFKIIEKNWNFFKDIFKDLGNLRTWINECSPIRNMVAHNIRTDHEERENIKIKAKYICNLIENSN